MPRRGSEYTDVTPLDTKKRVFITEVDTYIGRHILNYFTAGTRKNEFVVQGTLSEGGFAKVVWPEPEGREEENGVAADGNRNKDAFQSDPFESSPGADSTERVWGYWTNPAFLPARAQSATSPPSSPSPSQFPHAVSSLYRLVPRHMENNQLFDSAIVDSDIVVAVLNDSTHEAEVAIRILSTTHSDCEKTFVVVSSVMTWANTRNAALAYGQIAKMKRVIMYKKLLIHAAHIRKTQASRIAAQANKKAAKEGKTAETRNDDDNDERDAERQDSERSVNRSEDDDGDDAERTMDDSTIGDSAGNVGNPDDSAATEAAEMQEQIDRFVDRTERADLLPRTFKELASLLGWSASPSFAAATESNESAVAWERLQSERFAMINRAQVDPVEEEEGAPMTASDELVLNDLRELGVNLFTKDSTQEDVRTALYMMRRLEAAWLERGENEEMDDNEDDGNEDRQPESAGFNEEEGLDAEPGKVWTEQEYQKRVPHAKYQHWKALEQLTKRSNSETLHTYVVFRGLAYGDGEEEGGVLQYVCRAAWSGEPPPIIEGPVVADAVASLINYDQFLYRGPAAKHSPPVRQRNDGEDAAIVPFTVVDQFDNQDKERAAAEKHARDAEVFRRIVVAQCASHTARASAQNRKCFTTEATELDNHIPMIHISDLSRLVYQVATSYVTLEDRHIFAVDSGTVTLRSLLQAVYQVFKGPVPPPRLPQQSSPISGNSPLVAVAAAASSTAHVTPIPHHATATSLTMYDESKSVQINSLVGYEYLTCDVRCSPTLALEVIDGATGGQRAGDDGVDEASKQVFENTEDAPGEAEDDMNGDDGGDAERNGGDKLHGPSFVMDDDEAQHPQWMSLKGFVTNCKRIVKNQFIGAHRLQPIRVVVNGPPYSGKSSVAEALALMYNVPSLTLGDIVASYEEYADMLEMRLRILHAQWVREQRRMAHALGISLPSAVPAAADSVVEKQNSRKGSRTVESGEDDAANESTNRSEADSEKARNGPEHADSREDEEEGEKDDESFTVFLELLDSLKDGKTQFFADLHPAELLQMVKRAQLDTSHSPMPGTDAGALLLPQPYEEFGVSAEEKDQRKQERQQKLILYFKSIRELYIRKATRLAKELNLARRVLSMKRARAADKTESAAEGNESRKRSKDGSYEENADHVSTGEDNGGEDEVEESQESDAASWDPVPGLALHVSALYAEEAIALMVRWRLRQKDCQMYGFILDGFPTTVRQAWLIFQNSPLLSNDDEDENGNEDEGNEENGSEYSNEGGKGGEHDTHAGQQQNATPVFDGMSIAREIMGSNPQTGETTDFLGADAGGGDEGGEGSNSIRDGRVLHSIPDEELFVSHTFSVINTYFPQFPTYATSSGVVVRHAREEPESLTEALRRAAGEIDALIASRLPAQFGIDKKYIDADFNEEESVDPESFLTPTDPRSFPDCVIVLNATDEELHRAACKHIQAMVDAHCSRRSALRREGSAGGRASRMLQEQVHSSRLENEMLKRFFDGLQKFRDSHLEGGPYTESLLTWFQSCLMATEPEHPFTDTYRWVSASVEEEFAPVPADAQGENAEHESKATSRMVSVSTIGAPLVSVFEGNAVKSAEPSTIQKSLAAAEKAKLQRTVEEIAGGILEVHRPHPPSHNHVVAVDDVDVVDTRDFAEEHWDAENLRYDVFDDEDDDEEDTEQDNEDHHGYHHSKSAAPLNPTQKRRETWQQRTYLSRASVDYASLPESLHSPSAKSGMVVDDRVLEELAVLMKRNSVDAVGGAEVAAVQKMAAENAVAAAAHQSTVGDEGQNEQAWHALREERVLASKELDNCVLASRKVLHKAHVGPPEKATPARGGEALTTQEYLMAYVMPALSTHMKNVVSIRPEDPISALADALYQCGEVPKSI